MFALAPKAADAVLSSRAIVAALCYSLSLASGARCGVGERHVAPDGWGAQSNPLWQPQLS